MKVLLLGANGFGFEHAKSYKKMGIEFSVFSRNKDVLKEYCQNYGVKETYSDMSEAINSQYDVADMVLPHTMHREYARKAMKMGRHVLIEKPISTSLEDANAMIRDSKENNVKFMVAEQFYFDSSARKVEKMIKEGKLGKILTVIIRSQQIFQLKGWRQSEKEMGGGGLIDGGIHYLQTFLDFGGKYTEVKSLVNKGKSSIEGEDNSLGIFKFDSGASGLFYYSWAYDHPPRVPRYEVIGTDGSIYEGTSEGNGGKRVSYGQPLFNGKKINVDEVDVIDAEISGFLHAVERDEEVPYKPEIALRNLKAVLDIYNNQIK